MGELSEECAVLASDGADEKEAQRLQQLLQVKPWKGKYALPQQGTETENSSAVYRAVPDPSNPDCTKLGEAAVPQFPNIKSLYLLLKEAARIFGKNLYVGERRPINDGSSPATLSGFKYFTYADTLRMVESLGRALDQEVGVSLSHYDDEANYRGIVTVPLYDTLGEESVKHIIKQTKMEVLAAEGSKLDAALRLKKEGFPLKAVISFDEPTKEQIEAFREAGVGLYHQEKLRRKYLSIPDEKSPEELAPSLDDVCTIIFTSGNH
ncbi:long chain acyl-CoA synthetase, putative [Eimeria mitis]|uniref:Long chain acyl-CoA synthetase, putative n=1 Tax=Eimeria mitis TaxID=44415 RepID=U6K0W3_9EIME|nr:long chain acyl-CoA synthetase, putative [Eimeria mitis]CDJ30641.1 long chain acyl-CoA synthetase, putative [Eimeria mitis]